jgi:hypothetical protein
MGNHFSDRYPRVQPDTELADEVFDVPTLSEAILASPLSPGQRAWHPVDALQPRVSEVHPTRRRRFELPGSLYWQFPAEVEASVQRLRAEDCPVANADRTFYLSFGGVANHNRPNDASLYLLWDTALLSESEEFAAYVNARVNDEHWFLGMVTVAAGTRLADALARPDLVIDTAVDLLSLEVFVPRND